MNTCKLCGTIFPGRKKKYCGEQCAADAKKNQDRKRSNPNPHDIAPAGFFWCETCKQFLPDGDGILNKGRLRKCRSCKRAERARCKPAKKCPTTTQRFIGAQTRLAEKNARQAWGYWLKNKASDSWMEKYYNATGRPWSNPRLSDAESYRLRYKYDSDFSIKERIRRQLNKLSKKDGIGDIIRAALVREGESNAVRANLGYSITDLKAHLERQFVAGMDWRSFCDGKIHIDHIVPKSAFNLSDPEQWKACWALSNLRPVWARVNLQKSDRLEFLL